MLKKRLKQPWLIRIQWSLWWGGSLPVLIGWTYNPGTKQRQPTIRFNLLKTPVSPSPSLPPLAAVCRLPKHKKEIEYITNNNKKVKLGRDRGRIKDVVVTSFRAQLVHTWGQRESRRPVCAVYWLETNICHHIHKRLSLPVSLCFRHPLPGYAPCPPADNQSTLLTQPLFLFVSGIHMIAWFPIGSTF